MFAFAGNCGLSPIGSWLCCRSCRPELLLLFWVAFPMAELLVAGPRCPRVFPHIGAVGDWMIFMPLVGRTWWRRDPG